MSATGTVSVRSLLVKHRSIVSRDFVFALLMALMVLPAFRIAHLRIRLDLAAFAEAYWGGATARSVFCAVILGILTLPPSRLLFPALHRYRLQKARLAVVAVMCLWMCGLF